MVLSLIAVIFAPTLIIAFFMTTRKQQPPTRIEGVEYAPHNKTPRSTDIEGIIKDAIALRTKMQCILWDTTFDNQFADEIDAMQTEVNSIIANCAPLLGWARAGELGDYITPAIASKTKPGAC